MWIKMCDDLLSNPKLRRLCRSTGWDEDQAIGKMYRFWMWALKYAEDGDLRKFTNADFEDALNYAPPKKTSLINLLVDAGFVDREPYLRIHDWHEYVVTFLRVKYSGNSKKNKTHRLVERAYSKKKPKAITVEKRNSTVTALEQPCNSAPDLISLAVDLEGQRLEKPSRNSGVKHQTAPAKDIEEAKASAPQPPPNGNGRNGHANGAGRTDPPPGASGNDPGPLDERAEAMRFIRNNWPIREPIKVLNPDESSDGHTLLTRIAQDGLSGVKAYWLLFTRIGQSGYTYAQGRGFSIREFLRQMPELRDRNLRAYADLKRKFDDESRNFSMAGVGV